MLLVNNIILGFFVFFGKCLHYNILNQNNQNNLKSRVTFSKGTVRLVLQMEKVKAIDAKILESKNSVELETKALKYLLQAHQLWIYFNRN